MTENLSPAFEDRLEGKRLQYARIFNIDDLNDANDKSLLDIMLKTELMIEDLQAKIQELIVEDSAGKASDIKKLADLLRDATGTITSAQRTLAIDRRTRKDQETNSVRDYLEYLRQSAHTFYESRIIRVYCPSCKVMVGRYAPVHSHTAYDVGFQCDQCKRMVQNIRDERDVLHDVQDADWRKEHRGEVVLPTSVTNNFDEDDDLEINATNIQDTSLSASLDIELDFSDEDEGGNDAARTED